MTENTKSRLDEIQQVAYDLHYFADDAPYTRSDLLYQAASAIDELVDFARTVRSVSDAQVGNHEAMGLIDEALTELETS